MVLGRNQNLIHKKERIFIMEELKAKPGMPTRMVIGIAVLVAVVFGGGTYAYVSNKVAKEKNDLNAQITELQSKSSNTVAAPTTTTPSSNSSSTESSAATTYSHPELKYSLTLPSGYIGVDKYDCEGTCNSDLTLAKKVANGYYSDSNVSLQYYKSSNTLDKEADDYRNANKGDILEESDVKINGVAAKKFKVGGMAGGYDYLALSNGYILKIRQYPSNADNQKVLDSIISTFQFTK